MRSDSKEWEYMLEEILDNEDANMSTKEVEFVEDLSNNWRGKSLSDKQFDWLERIWQKANG